MPSNNLLPFAYQFDDADGPKDCSVLLILRVSQGDNSLRRLEAALGTYLAHLPGDLYEILAVPAITPEGTYVFTRSGFVFYVAVVIDEPEMTGVNGSTGAFVAAVEALFEVDENDKY